MNKSKIVECDIKEYAGKHEQFKKRKFVSSDGASHRRSPKTTTIMEQSPAQTSLGGARSSNSRGMGSPRGRGSWRPPVKSTSLKSGNTGGIVCYWCGVEGHIARDCLMPWVDKCY